MSVVTCTVSTEGLNKGLEMAMQFSKRAPAECVNTAALEVAFGAYEGMPFVTPQQVDQELAVFIAPALGKRGKPLQTHTKRGKLKAKNVTYEGGLGGEGRNPDVPLAALIQIARLRQGSKYNVSTNWRYQLTSNPFKGIPRSLIYSSAVMKDLVDTMIRARHSATSFLRAGWVNVIRTLSPLSVNKWRSRSRGVPLSAGNLINLGKAYPADSGNLDVTCAIENAVGTEGQNAESFNRALWEYGAGPLQNALNNEGVKQMQYYLDHAGADLETRFYAMQRAA